MCIYICKFAHVFAYENVDRLTFVSVHMAHVLCVNAIDWRWGNVSEFKHLCEFERVPGHLGMQSPSNLSLALCIHTPGKAVQEHHRTFTSRPPWPPTGKGNMWAHLLGTKPLHCSHCRPNVVPITIKWDHSVVCFAQQGHCSFLHRKRPDSNWNRL